MKIQWKTNPYSRFTIGKYEQVTAIRAIASWDPLWQKHAWAVEVQGPPDKLADSIVFSYKDKKGWHDGPVVRNVFDFDLAFRLWYEATFPLPEGYVRWAPSCGYCGVSLRNEKNHDRWCLGWWACKTDMRWHYPFGIFPSTDNDRYRKEGEVIAEIKAFGFRTPEHNDRAIYWKSLLKPSAEVLLNAGYLEDQWTRYWVKREVKRAIGHYSRVKHLEGLGYSYYDPRGSLICSVKKEDGLWYVYTKRRQKLPHGFERKDLAVACYFPIQGSMLYNLNRYVHESRWPIVRSKAYKSLQRAA
jgi:hypothetical protein